MYFFIVIARSSLFLSLRGATPQAAGEATKQSRPSLVIKRSSLFLSLPRSEATKQSQSHPSLKSSHSELSLIIKSILSCLEPPFNCFSLLIAQQTSSVSSEYTNLSTLYLDVNPLLNFVLCSYILLSKLFVTPTYKTRLYLLARM